jgi:tRNA A-37 threonylcarbamoyl transferase component Bud32
MNSVAQNMMDAALDQQKRAWISGRRPSVNDFLSDSSLPSEPDVLLDLIYNEIVVREELGEEPSIDEYIERYPHLNDDLRLHFEVHRAVQQDLLLNTQRLSEEESVPDLKSITAEIGPELKNYQILGELGQGGMGVVYKARHRKLKRLVALKMFHPGRRPKPRELTRFRSESEAIARLQHPNIVQIFEVGEDRGLPFLALELVEKGTLQQKLQDLPFVPRAAAELIETLARAIEHAHTNNVIHRDIKPANVLFANDGTPKITDFGLAKLLETDPDDPQDATRSGEPIGTPRYMSPEQTGMKSASIGPTTDIYALGTLLYECLTGQVPFVSSSVIETMNKIRHDEPVSPRRLQPTIPRDLETICLHCLHKQPDRRYASAQALADDLRHFLQGEPIMARRTPLWERIWMKARRHPTIALAMVIGFALMLAVAIAIPVGQYQERQRIAAVRMELITKEREATEQLAEGNARKALETYMAALAIIMAEPDLHEHALGVRGWLDHCLRDIEKQRWRERDRMPPLFAERKDNAIIQVMLTGSNDPESLNAKRKMVANALEFAVGNEANVGIDRAVLNYLDADLLDQLSLKNEADSARERAKPFEMQPAFIALFGGFERMKQRKWAEAVREFDRVLANEPEHFLARFLLAACYLELGKPREAEIALTACVGQRPNFAWSHLLRGRAYVQLNQLVPAAQDLQLAMDLKLNESARVSLLKALDALIKVIDTLPTDRKDAFWKEIIPTAQGRLPLRQVPLFQESMRNPKGGK